jgi:hypothetical protein
MELIKMKIKIISLLICTLFLMTIFPGITTATNTVRNDTSVTHSTMNFRDEPALIKITDKDAVCDLGNDYVVYAEGSTLYLYNIKTGKTENVVIGGNIVYPKISEDRVVYYDFVYMGFKMYNIKTGEKTDLIVTNWPGGDTDDFQFFGDNLVYQNFSSDMYETEIYLYKIASGDNTKLTNTPGENFPENPCIYNNIVAWQLTKGAQADIIMYNIENNQYTNVTHTSKFEADTYPTMYEHNIVYSYFYYDKPNGTRLYGLKMYNITTSEETTLLINGEPTGSTPELYGNIIIYSVAGERLLLYNYTTNYTVTLYEGTFLTQPWNVNENYVLFTILGDGAYLYRYTPLPPSIEITIKGGLGVSASIKNIGATNLTNISWNIALDGKLVFIGKNKTGTIDSLAVGESKTLKDFVLGFGKTNILVTAGSTTQNATATVIFFFVIGVK